MRTIKTQPTLYDYVRFGKYDAQDIECAISNSTRLELINFLACNDPNGLYTDTQRAKEGVTPLTDVEIALTIMRVMWENQTN